MATNRRRDLDDEFDDDNGAPRRRPREHYDAREDYADAPYGAGAHRGPVGKGVNVCGVISLILGLVGLIVSLIPCIGVIGLPLAAIGLVLGIIGIFTAGQTTGRGLPVAGMCVSAGGLLIGGAWLLFFVYLGNKGQQQATVRQQQMEAQRVADEEAARALEEQRKQEERELREGPHINVTAEKLYQDYETNAIGANTKYEHKVLELTGQFLRTDKDRFGRLAVELDAGGDGLIRCEFPRDVEAQLEKLKALQKVTIRGRCAGRDRKDVIKMTDCHLVSRK